jgi:polyhydroxyalkanoate synthesis regulator phasin
MPSTPGEGKAEKKTETPGEAEALRSEVSALREQLRALEDRLERKREK